VERLPPSPGSLKTKIFHFSAQFGAVWCARVRPISDGISLQLFEISFISFISSKKWFSSFALGGLNPVSGLSLKMILGFLVSLFNFLIGFRIPICLCHLLCKKRRFQNRVPKRDKNGQKVTKSAI
jgi:hypothetical protein